MQSRVHSTKRPRLSTTDPRRTLAGELAGAHRLLSALWRPNLSALELVSSENKGAGSGRRPEA